MKTLTQHIEEINAKTSAWIAEDPDNRWGGMITTDLDHWARMGVTDVESYERYSLETTIWDFYKDVHGIRPRWMNFSSMSLEELQEVFDGLCVECDRQNEIERQEEEAERKQEQKLQQDLEKAKEPLMTLAELF